MKRRDHIDAITGLRAIAVLAVVLFHVDAAWLPGGFAGVDVFFVISGFVVAHAVTAYRSASWLGFLAQFYRRRLARLMPAAIVYVIVTTIATVLFVPYLAATANFETTGAAALLGFSNVLLMGASGGYFAAANSFHPFTHTWSLAVEEQYYLLFSLFAFPLLVRREGQSARWIAPAVALAALASLVASAVLTKAAPAYAFYMLLTRFWELALGLLLRIGLDGRLGAGLKRLGAGQGEALAWAAMAALLWSLATTEETRFPYPGALLPCLATAALLAAFWTWRDGRLAGVLRSRAFVWIGLVSYSLYLWHWGVIVFMRWTVGVDTPVLKAVAIAATFALGAASYYGVERRFQRLHARPTGTPDYMLRFGGALALVATLCFVAGPLRPRLGLARASDLAAWNPYGAPAEARPCEATPEQVQQDNALIVTFRALCRRPDARRLFVLGDSHAGAYQRLAWRLAETGEWDVKLYSLNGCSPVNLRPLDLGPDCRRFLDRSIGVIGASARAGDVVFLPALHAPLWRDAWGKELADGYEYGPGGITARTIAISRARLAGLAALPATLVIENTKPVMPVALFRCADWFNRGQTYCRHGIAVSRAETLERVQPIRDGLTSLTASLPRAVLWDPMAVLCRGVSCEGFGDGQPLYFDTDHLSAHGNDLLLPSFRAQLARLPG